MSTKIKDFFSKWGTPILIICAAGFVINIQVEINNENKQEKDVLDTVKKTYVSLISERGAAGKQLVDGYLNCLANEEKNTGVLDKSDCLYFTADGPFIESMITNINSLSVEDRFKEKYIGGKDTVKQFLIEKKP